MNTTAVWLHYSQKLTLWFRSCKCVEACLWHRRWSILVNIPWALGKKYVFCWVWCSFLQVAIKSCWLRVLLTSFMSLLILSAGSINCWEWGIDVSTYKWSWGSKAKTKHTVVSSSQSINKSVTKHLLVNFSILGHILDGEEKRRYGLS